MPALDGTGPAGMGPMTGGARGWCNPYSPLRIEARFAPYGLYGAPYAPTMTREQEIEMLQDQAKYFQDALDDIIKRIEELEQEA